MVNTLGRWLFAKLGWKLEGALPDAPRYLVAVAPHSSNWDFVIGMLARCEMREWIYFLGKKQLFMPPLGYLMRKFGGSPVDRSRHNNMVEAVIALFNQDPNYKLALAPEGTRAPAKRWKTGFYHIAHGAGVPIVTVGMDYQRKKVIICPPFMPSGDIHQDMPQLVAFFKSVHGLHPKKLPDF